MFKKHTVDDAYIETHEMLVRFARRCAYDLRHAVDMLNKEDRAIFGKNPIFGYGYFKAGIH